MTDVVTASSHKLDNWIDSPKCVPHSWRNSRGFEQCVQTIRNSLPEKLEAVAASYGCYIVGLPVSL
jgi:hypothetical protein